MPTNLAPLGAELHRLRTLAGISTTQLAHLIGMSQSAVSRFDRGERRPDRETVRAWHTHCLAAARNRLDDRSLPHWQYEELQAAVTELDDPAFPDRLERLLDDAETEVASMFTIYRQGLVQRQRALWAELSTATQLRSFGAALVPGQLQTEEYARQLFALDAEHAGLRPTDIDAAIAGRLDFGRSIRARPDATFHAVVTEYALRLPLPGSSPRLRAELLRNLIDAAACPNITVQILPMSAPVPSMILGNFGIAEAPDGKATVYVETYSAQLTFTAARDLAEYEHRWRLFAEAALTPHETIRWAHQHLE